jgi:hypothetical protein
MAATQRRESWQGTGRLTATQVHTFGDRKRLSQTVAPGGGACKRVDCFKHSKHNRYKDQAKYSGLPGAPRLSLRLDESVEPLAPLWARSNLREASEATATGAKATTMPYICVAQ